MTPKGIERGWFAVDLFSEQISKLSPLSRLTLPPVRAAGSTPPLQGGQLPLWPFLDVIALVILSAEWVVFHRGL